MSRVAFVDGRYLPLGAGAISVEDRGFQFADAVYEVCEVRTGRLVDEAAHIARLHRSLGKIRMTAPMSDVALGVVMREVVRRNAIVAGLVYLQVTRGVAPRGHAFPSPAPRPTLVVTARRTEAAARMRAEEGIAVVTVPETRWARVDIKSVGLLPNVLAKQAAVEAGAGEAWFVGADGMVHEGASSNAWIVTGDGQLVTAPVSAPILAGITRAVVLEVAGRLHLTFTERLFSIDEAIRAEEAFVTSATALVTPVTRIDGQAIGNGQPGPTSRALRSALAERVVHGPQRAGPVA